MFTILKNLRVPSSNGKILLKANTIKAAFYKITYNKNINIYSLVKWHLNNKIDPKTFLNKYYNSITIFPAIGINS